MGPTNQLGYLLQHLAFMLGRHSDQVLSEQLGIGMSQFKILMSLQWNPNVQQRQIADNLGQTEASISRQIHLLEEQGMLTSEVSQKSKREHIIRPTQKGIRITDKAMELLRTYHAPMFSKLSTKQRDNMMECLGILHGYTCGDTEASGCYAPLQTKKT